MKKSNEMTFWKVTGIFWLWWFIAFFFMLIIKLISYLIMIPMASADVSFQPEEDVIDASTKARPPFSHKAVMSNG
jgi:hypothetical protein